MRQGLLSIAVVLALLAGAPGIVQAAPLPVSDVQALLSAFSSEDRDDDQEDASFSLSAAYPNPFQTRTRFDLRLEEAERVSVEVYNILGQRVRTLYEGRVSAQETRTFTFEARNLPSGLYLYRVEGESFTAARRVTLVR